MTFYFIHSPNSFIINPFSEKYRVKWGNVGLLAALLALCSKTQVGKNWKIIK